MKNQNYVTLSFLDFEMNPQELTKQLGIEPTVTGIKGEADLTLPSIKRIWSYNCWQLRSSLDQEASIERHLDNLLAQIEAHKANFQKFSQIYKTQLGFVMYFGDNSNPEIHLTKDQIRHISELGVEVDFDIYCLRQ